jgi:hypothetical protein
MVSRHPEEGMTTIQRSTQSPSIFDIEPVYCYTTMVPLHDESIVYAFKLAATHLNVQLVTSKLLVN